MQRRVLKNKPLIEAILEVRWNLVPKGPGAETDPHYKLLLGRLFDRLQVAYPEYEQLPTASIPDELVGHVVQHRFRVGLAQWPLVQLGPGILTVNSTAEYTWEDFQQRAVSAVARLFESYPKPAELAVSNVILRFIDAVAFDYQSGNAFAFLREKLKLGLNLPLSLFEGGVSDSPLDLTWRSAFRCSDPNGVVAIQVSLGQKEGQPAIVWDTSVQSAGNDLPHFPDQFAPWIDAAHVITSDWFFKLIEGDLERRFDGE